MSRPVRELAIPKLSSSRPKLPGGPELPGRV